MIFEEALDVSRTKLIELCRPGLVSLIWLRHLWLTFHGTPLIVLGLRRLPVQLFEIDEHGLIPACLFLRYLLLGENKVLLRSKEQVILFL